MSLYWYVFEFGICHGPCCVADAVFRVWDVVCCKRSSLGYVVYADVWDVLCCRRPMGMY